MVLLIGRASEPAMLHLLISWCSWDLRSGQRGSVDRISLAHIGPVLSLDWCNPRSSEGGWVASAGLDKTVKVITLPHSYTASD